MTLSKIIYHRLLLRFSLILMMTASIVMSFTLSFNIHAAEGKKKPSSDVRVLVDMSGSMKKNDPDNLRIPAVQLMSNLLPPDSQAGIWTFGASVNMLVPLKRVDNDWKKFAVESAKKINSSGLFTNIGGAMEQASFGWTKADPDIKRSLILLTDGVVDVSKDPAVNAAARRKVLKELLPQYKKAGITIHTIALSGDADAKLLSSMASETDGWYQKVADASELQKVFLKIFEQATERDSVPLTDNKFTIDDQIEEFTLLVFKNENSKPTILEQPDGESYDAATDTDRISWFESPSYDLITISSPMTGEWRAIADIDPDNRVLVVSNLKIKSTALPNNLLANEKFIFTMRLLQDGDLVDEIDFLNLLEMQVDVTSAEGVIEVFSLVDDGTAVDEEANDGIYSVELTAPSEAGLTQISATVESPTFHRMRQQALNIFTSPVSVEQIISSDLSKPHKLIFTPVVGVSKAESLQIDVEVQLPNKQALDLVAEKEKGYSKSIEIPNSAAGGVYWVQLTVNGETPSGREFQVKPPVIQFSIETQNAIEKEAPVEEVEVEDENNPEEKLNIMLWLGIGLGLNVLLILLGWLVSKMLKKRNLANAKKMSEQLE